MRRLVRYEAVRKVLPRGAGPKDPEYGVEDLPRILQRATRLPRATFPIPKKRFDDQPLFIGKLFTSRHASL